LSYNTEISYACATNTLLVQLCAMSGGVIALAFYSEEDSDVG